jgi:hypothetical protein
MFAVGLGAELPNLETPLSRLSCQVVSLSGGFSAPLSLKSRRVLFRGYLAQKWEEDTHFETKIYL